MLDTSADVTATGCSFDQFKYFMHAWNWPHNGRILYSVNLNGQTELNADIKASPLIIGANLVDELLDTHV